MRKPWRSRKIAIDKNITSAEIIWRSQVEEGKKAEDERRTEHEEEERQENEEERKESEEWTKGE